MYNKNYNEIVSVKPYPEGYTQEILNNIKLITVGKDELNNIFGSVMYRVQPYPSDIDTAQTYRKNLNVNKLIIQFSKNLKETIKNIIDKEYHYITEIKIGLDDRYKYDIGTLRNGLYRINRELRKYINVLYDNKLLGDEEFFIIKNLVKSIINRGGFGNQNEYDTIYNILREHLILRWKPEEVLRGYKILTGNKKITVEEALGYITAVKIDMITIINNRFIEVTNFLLLIDKDNNIINLGEHYDNNIIRELSIRTLPQEIEKLLFSDYYKSYFKACKRMWALARIIEDTYIISKVTPFIKGSISYLYMLKSEIDTIILLCEIVKNPPINKIKYAIDNIKYKLNNIMAVNSDELLKYINMFNNYLNNPNIDILKDLVDRMKDIINYKSINYLKLNGLLPPPPEYLPDDRKYV